MQLSDILSQGDKIDALLAQADKILSRRREAYDRIFHTLQASYTFVQGENTTQDLALNVPEGNDFEATRLAVYPELRLISTDPTTQGPDDKTFRPASWFADLLDWSLDGFVNSSIDAMLAISYHSPQKKSRPYSGTPFFAGTTFGGTAMRTAVSSHTTSGFGGFWNRSETPGGLAFDPFFLLDAGSTFVVSVTPTYSGIRQTAGQDGRLYEYRIRCVLEGYKRVRK